MKAGNKKHTQHAPSTKTECDYLNGWIKKTVTYAKISPRVVNPRDIAGERKKTKPKQKKNKTKQRTTEGGAAQEQTDKKEEPCLKLARAQGSR